MTADRRDRSSAGARERERALPGRLAEIRPLAARKFVIGIRRLADDITYGLDGSRFQQIGRAHV